MAESAAAKQSQKRLVARLRDEVSSRTFFGPATRITFVLLLFIEVVSLSAVYLPDLNPIIFALLVLTVFAVSAKDLKYGVYVVLAELVIGSKGYLFSLDLGDFRLSLRLGVFLAVFLAWAIHFLLRRQRSFFTSRFSNAWFGLILALIIGAGIGMLRGNGLSNVFLDINGYLFLGLAPVFYQVLLRKDVRQEVFQVFTGALGATIFKTLVILFAFSHKLIGITTELYTWVRATGVGEISDLGGYFRVFFQSHVYGLLLFFVVGGILAFAWKRSRLAPPATHLPLAGMGTLFVGGALLTLISLSRSLWVAFLLTIAIGSLYLLRADRIGFKRLVWLGIGTAGAFVLSFLIFFGTIHLPLPGGGGGGSSTGLISERTTDLTEEAAAASRWKLFPQLLQANLTDPLLGAGFGKTVTYETEDPRYIDTHGHNRITTFSFEWGYLDIWLKTGIFGLLMYAWLLTLVLRQGLSIARDATGPERGLHLGLVFSLVALLLTHATTPYLNHPLGIGWLLFVAAFWSARERTEFLVRRHEQKPPLPDKPSVSVNIVTYNSKEDIRGCLDSLKQQTYSHITVRILDSASQDDTVTFVKNAYPEVGLIASEENVGFAKGQNALAKETTEDLLFLLNPDATLESTYIEEIVRVMQSNSTIGAAQGTILRLKNGEQTAIIDSTGIRLLSDFRAVERRGGEDKTAADAEPTEIFGTTGAAAIIRTDAIHELIQQDGEFLDETFFMYKDDVDLAYRLRHRGWNVYTVPSAVGYHDRWETGSSEDANTKELMRLHEAKPGWMQERSYQNHFKTIQKNVFLRVALRHSIRFKATEGAKAGYLLIHKPKILGRSLLALLKDFRVILGKRRHIQANTQLEFSEQNRWINKT